MVTIIVEPDNFKKFFDGIIHFWRLLAIFKHFWTISVVFRILWHLQINSKGFWQFGNLLSNIGTFLAFPQWFHRPLEAVFKKLVICFLETFGPLFGNTTCNSLENPWHSHNYSRGFCQFGKVCSNIRKLLAFSQGFSGILNFLALSKWFHRTLRS